MSALLTFSENNISIGAECPKCGRVLKIQKANTIQNVGGFALLTPVICPCNQTYTEIVHCLSSLINEKTFLTELALCSNVHIAKSRIEKVTNQGVLCDIAKMEFRLLPRHCRELRVAAVKKITDQAMLADLALTAPAGEYKPYYSDIAWDAHVNADWNDWSKEELDPDARETAVKRLTDETLLAKIAASDNRKSVRDTAIETISNLRSR